ncbi:MAG: hypothetical protein COW18_00445 [Zetaproteobacteria bacterium CG12_big_fil_rev_8_21_14_0_65_54_13]|nr:MAG: hypothetical protein COX55_03905 [Zetaproteobacteria bacterium CG23_combo_of_CG06-09_8_20_14_all_54_7]PIW51548.1 MAG: hypothetical protein COW18_00445 [Zetaproteobacteria bacterium CG12_big_fil_rev_8_21_14_0_65_54_13]PIX53626.1 MAG: hypothetical protein COZ50_12160 [Zetaproteobacteria bacterium CG_4_10_14_3_um_filter_54_28]PJA27916.1 MAG: hypothetical protein CO188_11200 [Zetaproteobacteria bacterium CG_4_9_14_3_um_filter_54_145]
MLVILFLLLSIPIGLFAAWFAWQAYKVDKRGAAWGMCGLSLLSFSSAAIVLVWVYALALRQAV